MRKEPTRVLPFRIGDTFIRDGETLIIKKIKRAKSEITYQNGITEIQGALLNDLRWGNAILKERGK